MDRLAPKEDLGSQAKADSEGVSFERIARALSAPAPTATPATRGDRPSQNAARGAQGGEQQRQAASGLGWNSNSVHFAQSSDDRPAERFGQGDAHKRKKRRPHYFPRDRAPLALVPEGPIATTATRGLASPP